MLSSINSCIEYDTKTARCKQVAGMNEARSQAGCTVFQGSAVVCGGFRENGVGDVRNFVYTVESYDHVADEWSYMPGMVRRGTYFKVFAVKNKLFAVGRRGESCQVYDSFSGKFVLMDSPVPGFNGQLIVAAFAVGSKILFFRKNDSTVVVHDVDGGWWCEEACAAAEYVNYANRDTFCCIKSHQLI